MPPERSSGTERCVALLLHDVTDERLTSGFRQPSAQKYKHSLVQFGAYLDTVQECLQTARSESRQDFRLTAEGVPPTENDSRLTEQDVPPTRKAPTESLDDFRYRTLIRTSARTTALFTFDDGGCSAMQTADLLEERSFRGLFFITTDFIGQPGFLSQNQLRELHDRGHVIGSHSCSHPDVFRSLAANEMQREWADSRLRLEDILGAKVTVASVPGGDANRETFRQAAKAGLEDVFTSEPITQPWRCEGVRCFGRMKMIDTTSPESVRRWLQRPTLGTLPERADRIARSTAKVIVGPIYRGLMNRRRAKHEAAGSIGVEEHPGRQPATDGRSRVVALINPTLHCRATVAELLKAGVNVAGIVEAQPKSNGLPLKTMQRLLRNDGAIGTASSIAARTAYKLLRRRNDQATYQSLFNSEDVDRAFEAFHGPTISCASYDDVIDEIAKLRPEILVVHSQSWVGRRVRKLPASGLVLGGHPGITPHYRGTHSPFWAIANGEPSQVGWTTFHIDKGVDTGDVIVQGRLEIDDDDSFMTLNWKGMQAIAQSIAETILHFDRTGEVPRTAHASIPEDSDYGHPRITDLLRYWKQRRELTKTGDS